MLVLPIENHPHYSYALHVSIPLPSLSLLLGISPVLEVDSTQLHRLRHS
jgi:hypothetical protein